ncbi:MAG TPA: ATP-binding protein [Solirubrobacteraceae bacterium]|nr:ATP-binding protein [Solirubrobacteraceae bacterium]
MRGPRRTVRLKLTLLYGALFLVSGGILLTITNLVVRNATTTEVVNAHVPVAALRHGAPVLVAPAGLRGNPVAISALKRTQFRLSFVQRQAAQVASKLRRVVTIARGQPTHELHQLLITSLAALGVMAIVSIGLGWLVAGRVLRPVRTITAAARDISASSLHQRLALDGPDDELHELGSTFDALLGRLEASFEAQRQFVANASHELRTPLARQRTVAEVALSDPDATVESLRQSHERVLAAGEQQERLIEALLTLARSERGLARRESFDLAAVAESVLGGRGAELERRSLRVEAALAPAPALGEPRLAERLVANLIDNAIRHNVDSTGWVRVATALTGNEATISVTNTGPLIPPGEVERLVQPFQRLDGDRVAEREGVGLGLSIADAIARAHGGELAVKAQPGGGLAVEATFPVFPG